MGEVDLHLFPREITFSSPSNLARICARSAKPMACISASGAPNAQSRHTVVGDFNALGWRVTDGGVSLGSGVWELFFAGV